MNGIATQNEMKPICELIEGDCFFFQSDASRSQIDKEIAAVDKFRRLIGDTPLAGNQKLDFWRSRMTSYMVYAIVRSTGERCVHRLSDDKYLIWYDGGRRVLHSPDRTTFLETVEANKKARMELEKEQQRMQRARSKKENRKQLENEVA